jgi:transglutaminase-like putative cysteine protease
MADSSVRPEPSFLRPTRFIDSDHPRVVAFARDAVGDATTDLAKASRVFTAVREALRYDPYTITLDPEDYKASNILGHKASYCIPKAVLLCAAARAAGLPARLGFADVKNHLSSEKLIKVLGTDLFAWHGYVELWIDGRPIKATPAFNAGLCARFGVPPLELDGVHDAMLQPYDGEGRRYMEYVHDRGFYTELPLDEICATFASLYAGGGAARDAAHPLGADGHSLHDEAFHGPRGGGDGPAK